MLQEEEDMNSDWAQKILNIVFTGSFCFYSRSLIKFLNDRSPLY